MQRSGSHIGLQVERGGSPSGSRKGFIDKTRVISLSGSGLGKETKTMALRSFSYMQNQISTLRRGVTGVSDDVLNVIKMLMYDTNMSEECVRGGVTPTTPRLADG